MAAEVPEYVKQWAATEGLDAHSIALQCSPSSAAWAGQLLIRARLAAPDLRI